MKTKIYISWKWFASFLIPHASYLIPLLLVLGCKNDDFNYGIRPEGQRDFTLLSPKTETTILLNSGDPEKEIVLEWNESKSGLGSEVTYEWLAINPDGSFESPLIKFTADDEGKATKLTLTGKSLDDALASAGVANGAQTTLHWSVKASNPTFSKIAPDPFVINIKRFAEGVSPFNLIAPTNNTNLVLDEDLPESEITITWDAPELINTSTVTYKWLAVLIGGNFENPILSFDSDEAGTQPKLTLTQKELDEALGGLGFKRAEKTNLQWTVVATSAGISQTANGPFSLRVIRFGIPKEMYLVGGSSYAGWAPEKAIPFVEVSVGKFELYSYLTVVGDGFKFLPFKGKYDGDWGKSKVEEGSIVQENEDNATVSEDGFYKIDLDFSNNSYSIQKVNWGIIGSAVPNDWPGPDNDMIYDPIEKVLKATLDIVPGEMKFRANDDWALNFGGDKDNLSYGGANIIIAEGGNYTITLNLDPSFNGKYFYTMTKN